jgi:hypothetical protein
VISETIAYTLRIKIFDGEWCQSKKASLKLLSIWSLGDKTGQYKMELVITSTSHMLTGNKLKHAEKPTTAKNKIDSLEMA